RSLRGAGGLAAAAAAGLAGLAGMARLGGIRAAGRATPFLYVHAAREPDQLALQRPAGGTGRAPPGHRARGARRAAAARHAEGPAPGTAQAGLFPRPRAAAGDR